LTQKGNEVSHSVTGNNGAISIVRFLASRRQATRDTILRYGGGELSDLLLLERKGLVEKID